MTQTTQNKIDDELKLKKRQTFIFWLVIILLLLFFLTSIYFICFYSPPLIISPQTTRITGPLTSDGQIDFFRYVEETYFSNPQIATDDNGFRIFTRTFGNVGECASMSQYFKEQKYKKLGLDINIPPTMTMPESPIKIISDYYAGLGKAIPNDFGIKMISKLWTLEEAPMLAEWIETIDEPLDAIAEMIRKPIFVCPIAQEESPSNEYQPLIALLLPDGQNFRGITFSFWARANYRIAKGDIDGAINDTITIYQLGRQLGKDANFFISLLIAISIEDIANKIPLDANPNHPLTKEQLQRLLDAIDQLPPRVDFLTACEFERISLLDTTQMFVSGGRVFLSRCGLSGIQYHTFDYLILFRYFNQNVAFRRVNEAYDIQIGKKTGNISDYYMPSSTSALFKNLFTSGGRGIIAANVSVSFYMTDTDIIDVAFKRIDCSFNMKRLTLALMMYKSEHGDYPKSDWIEKIKPYWGDNFEKSLHCPACPNQEKGKTNYALILYDKLPENKNALLLVELRDPVPFDQAVIAIDKEMSESELSEFISKIGSFHNRGITTARQSGAIRFIFDSDYKDSSKMQKLIDQNPDDNAEESKNNFDY